MLAILAGTLFTSCKNNEEKKEDALEEIQDANEDLNAIDNEVKAVAVTKANDAEWQIYKTQANKTISENEVRILELQLIIKKRGISYYEDYRKGIDASAEKNTILKNRIINYEKNQTYWLTFKREFDSDMSGFGKAFEDIIINNKKKQLL
jgi:hypothetical protein